MNHSNNPSFCSAANDGLVSVASLLMGVGAGSTSVAALRLAGVAGLVGGALSMAVGEYISVASQRDAELADIEQERREQLKGPAAQVRRGTREGGGPAARWTAHVPFPAWQPCMHAPPLSAQRIPLAL